MNKLSFFLYLTSIMSLILCFGCEKDPVIPTVETGDVINITSNSAVCSGTIRSNGGAEIIESGIKYWSGYYYDDDDAIYSGDGTSKDSYTSTLQGLSPDTQYNCKAYARNSEGTRYGGWKTFTTLP